MKDERIIDWMWITDEAIEKLEKRVKVLEENTAKRRERDDNEFLILQERIEVTDKQINGLIEVTGMQNKLIGEMINHVKVLEANQNYLQRDYNAAKEFKELAKAVRESRAAENKGGMTLTAEQVEKLKNWRAQGEIISILGVLDEILK